MVVPESEIMSQAEVESPLQAEQQPSRNLAAFASLGRQSSIYSLTLDEFQHTLCESGKNFGSMNMDEFLNSIWTAEENQAQAQAHATHHSNPTGANTAVDNCNHNIQFLAGDAAAGSAAEKGIPRQLSLSRQGSLTLPAPLCQKTVDEVWSEIHKSQQEQHRGGGNNNSIQNSGSAQRQATFGEMTLEDFLIRAGVVREQCNPPPPAQPAPYGMYQNSNNPGVGPSFVSRPIMASAAPGGGGGVNMPAYQAMPQGGVAETPGYVGNGKRSGYHPPPPPAVCYGGSGGGGYGLGMGSPVSPVSSDGICAGHMDGAHQYGMDMGGMRGGRKRIMDGGPVEKVVEKRQRRMIKNRESAARSRARKQAYTVELEAELNQLKEENAQLKQALAELERKRKQQVKHIWCNLMATIHAEYYEEVKAKANTKAQKAKDRLRLLRRSSSCPV